MQMWINILRKAVTVRLRKPEKKHIVNSKRHMPRHLESFWLLIFREDYVGVSGLDGLDTTRVLGHHSVGVMWNIEDWTLQNKEKIMQETVLELKN